MNPNMKIYRRQNLRLLVQVGVGLGVLHWANMSNISLTHLNLDLNFKSINLKCLDLKSIDFRYHFEFMDFKDYIMAEIGNWLGFLNHQIWIFYFFSEPIEPWSNCWFLKLDIGLTIPKKSQNIGQISH